MTAIVTAIVTVIVTAIVTDCFVDVAGGVRYSLYPGDPDGYFSIDPVSGGIRTAAILDHESHQSVLLNVQATSGDPPAYGHTQVSSLCQYSARGKMPVVPNTCVERGGYWQMQVAIGHGAAPRFFFPVDVGFGESVGIGIRYSRMPSGLRPRRGYQKMVAAGSAGPARPGAAAERN